MIGWKEYKIGDLCNTISETYKGNDEEVILINTSDVLEGKILNHIPVPNENLKGQFKKTFRIDDILYSEIRPANKRYAFVDIEDTSLYIASTKLMVLRPNTGIIEPKFLFALLSSKNMISELQVRAESRSGTFPQITFGAELALIKVMVPDKDIQLKIVSFLEAFQRKLDTNEAINRNLYDQCKLIYKEWFGENSQRESWNVISLEECCDQIIRGKSGEYVEKGKYANLNQKVNKGFVLEKQHYKYLNEEINIPEEKFGRPKDIILNSLGQGTLGRVHFLFDVEPNVVIDQHITIIRPDTNVLTPEYLYFMLESPEYQGIIENSIVGSTGMLMLNISVIRALKTIVPPIELQTEFTNIVENLYDLIEKNNLANEKLTITRDTLLQRLMSGELDVSEFDI